MRRLVEHRGWNFALRAIALVLACAPPASAQIPDPARLGRARAFDQLGVRAFREGHYRDAIRFFEAASRLGGPSSEIWNMARCYQKLDEPEEAMRALQHYLEQSDLMPSERAEAAKELEDLRARPSQLAVDSDPSGAAVSVDGKLLPSPTPVTVEVAVGRHRVRVEGPGGVAQETEVEARLGRAIVVSVALGGSSSASSESVLAPSDATPAAARRFLFSAEAGAFVARFGSVQGGPRPSAHLAADYVLDPDARVLVTAGLRFSLLSYGGPGWHMSPQCQLADGASPAELNALAMSGLAVRAGPRFRLGGDVGLGVAGLAFGASGPDAGKPTCTGASGLAFLAHAGLRGSFALSQAVRFTFSPLAFEAHPAFHGTRKNPPSTVDASGLWWRLGTTVGFAFDAK